MAAVIDASVLWFRHETPSVAPLRAEVASQVVVVGGGIAGLTCALSLAERGVEVTLVERAFCGAGASGRSSGFITPDSELELSNLLSSYGERWGRELWEFARSGVERIRRTIQQLAIECDYQVQDSLLVASNARAFHSVIELEHRAHQSLGYPSILYDRDSLAAVLGSPAYHGGVRYDGTFGIDAYAYCRALRDELERRGVRIYEGTPVVRLGSQGVETADGRIKAETVAVLTDRDLPALGLAEREVAQLQAFLSASRPLGADRIAAIFPESRLMVWDTDVVYQYFRITGEGRLLLGVSRLSDMYWTRGAGARRATLRKLRRYVAETFPSLDLELEFLWPGLIGVSKDFVPVLGRHAALPAVYFAGAGAGLPWSAALGDYLAGKITDGRGELDEVLCPDRPYRIGGRLQRLLGKPAAFLLSHGVTKYLRKG